MLGCIAVLAFVGLFVARRRQQRHRQQGDMSAKIPDPAADDHVTVPAAPADLTADPSSAAYETPVALNPDYEIPVETHVSHGNLTHGDFDNATPVTKEGGEAGMLIRQRSSSYDVAMDMHPASADDPDPNDGYIHTLPGTPGTVVHPSFSPTAGSAPTSTAAQRAAATVMQEQVYAGLDGRQLMYSTAALADEDTSTLAPKQTDAMAITQGQDYAGLDGRHFTYGTAASLADEATPTLAHGAGQLRADASLVQDANAIYIQVGLDSPAATAARAARAARAAPAPRSARSNGKPDTMTRPDYQAPPAYELPNYEQSEYADVDYEEAAEPDAMYETYEAINGSFQNDTLERKLQLVADGGLRLISVRRTNPLAANANPDEVLFPVKTVVQPASTHTELAGEDHTYEYQGIGRDGKVDSTLPSFTRPKAQPDPDYIDPNAPRSAMLAGEDHTYAYQNIGSSTTPSNHNSVSNGVTNAEIHDEGVAAPGQKGVDNLDMSTGRADASLVQDANAIYINVGLNSPGNSPAAPAVRSLGSNVKPDSDEPPNYEQSEYADVDYSGDAVYETYENITEPDGSALPKPKEQSDPDYIDPNAARSAILAGEDHTYEYQDIGSDGQVDSTLPRPKAQPDPDYVDPNAARSAMLAGVDHTYQDIGSSKPPGDDNDGELRELNGTISSENREITGDSKSPDDDNDGELYGCVLNGTIGSENREITGSHSGTQSFTRAADGNVYLRPAPGGGEMRPVGLRQSSAL